jgi:hypothetical protein
MAGVLDAVKAMQVAENQQRARQKDYSDKLAAGKAIGAASLAAPPGVPGLAVAGMGLMNDYAIAKMEEENPSLATGLGPQRYSTVGQLLGLGYPNQTGIPRTGIFERLRNVVTGGDGLPDPRTNIWNAKGNVITIVEPGPGAPYGNRGWETTGGDSGGDGPAASRGTSNFGGRESSIDTNDYSGYA